MSPENYQVWYEYTTGSMPELSEEMDGILSEGGTFDEEKSRSLYEKYFGADNQRKLLEEVSQATFRMLKEALEGLIATGTVTQDYSQRLSVFAARLERGDMDQDTLKSLIEEVILDTRKVERSNSELMQQLEKAKQEGNELRLKLEQAEREAIRDVLTRLYNRKYLDRALRAFYEHYKAEGVPFSVIMMDIDFFKRVNDTYGHKVGDSVLEFLGQTISASVKGRDVPARYGGEEFIILLPATSCEGACQLAESLRRQVSSKTLKVARTQTTIGAITVSSGVAEVREDDTIDSVVERADQALYHAKRSGRNRVVSERDLLEAPAAASGT